MKMVTNAAFAPRMLSEEETLLVSGGISTTTYWDNEGTKITEYWSDDGSQFYSLEAEYNAGYDASYEDLSGFFGCVGLSEGVAGGFCYGAGDLYVYLGFAVGVDGIPVDVTVGQSDNVAGYLNGLALAGNGTPGMGVSFNPDGSIASTAWVTGTPGASLTWGVNVDQALQNALEEFASGIYEMMGSPYDPPGGGGGGGGGGGDGGGFDNPNNL